jgi:hypothetical protein
MTSTEALAILRKEFPNAKIVEVPGGRNMLSWWLFSVDGSHVWVDTDGGIIESEAAA